VGSSSVGSVFQSVLRLLKSFWRRPESANEDAVSAPVGSDVYHSDAPLSDPDQDDFDRLPFARRIAETITTRNDPASLCIGIYGKWGEGKTTVLKFIEKELAPHENVQIIHFNPWRFRTEDDLFVGFFGALAGGIGKSLKSKHDRATEAIAPYAKILGSASIGVGVPMVGSINVSAAQLTRSLLESASADVETLKSRLEKLIKETKKKLVIVVDDTDRMDRKQIHAVFKLIKACGDFLYTIYVLAFDDNAVAAALATEYSGGDTPAGYDFLEKIVQVPLRLPAASETSLRRFFLSEVDRVLAATKKKLSEDQIYSFVDGFDRGFSRAVTTPRMAKRYGNALSFGLPLLAGEVSTVDFLLIEAMRVFFPTLYDFVKFNSETVLDPPTDYNKQATVDRVTKGIDTVEAEYRTDARRLLSMLFPRLESVFGNMIYSSESEIGWAKEKRVCSRQYFQRYFSYAIAKGDVSDRRIDELCATAEQRDATAVAQQLKDLMVAKQAESVLTNLWNRVDELSADAAAVIAKELALYGGVFSREGGFARLSTSTRAGGLVAALVERSPKGKARLDVAAQILREAVPIGFAAESLSWFRAGRDRPEAERRFSEAEAEQLCKILAERIDASADCSLIRNEANILLLMYVWSHFGRSDGPRELLQKCFQAEPTLILPYLRSAVGTAYPADGGRPHPGDFEKDAYDAVSKYIDAAIIYEALLKMFGDRLQTSPRSREVQNADERIAQEFAVLHASVVGRKSESKRGK
jgi:predicted KAP-like P-loop ATPase